MKYTSIFKVTQVMDIMDGEQVYANGYNLEVVSENNMGEAESVHDLIREEMDSILGTEHGTVFAMCPWEEINDEGSDVETFVYGDWCALPMDDETTHKRYRAAYKKAYRNISQQLA